MKILSVPHNRASAWCANRIVNIDRDAHDFDDPKSSGYFSTLYRGLIALTICVTLLASAWTAGAESNATDTCLLAALKTAPADASVGSLRERCSTPQATWTTPPAATATATAAPDATQTADATSLLEQRLKRERQAQEIRSILTPHNRNYLMPATYMRDPNEAPFKAALGDVLPDEQINNFEAKFQISLKFSLGQDLMLPNDQLYLGYTSTSFFQVYNSDISSPFRGTDYEPEIFYGTALPWRPFGLDATALTVGFVHESNGRGGTLSRSWNRVYTNFIVEKNKFVFSLKPWWRIPENKKRDPLDADGDDNPDIERFLGNFEFTTLYRQGDHEFGVMLRNNLRSDSKGAAQLDWTFPLWRGIKGYAQYFNGYGESLIDYDARIERFGVGILLTDLL